MLRRRVVLTVLFILAAGWLGAADRANSITIMTQNMDAGTDLGYIVSAFSPNPQLTLVQAVDFTFSEVQASNLERRAGLLAQKITEVKPDIVALQEATLWQGLFSSGPVVYDQLAFLLAALDRLGSPYEAVVVNQVNDVTLPGSQVQAVRMVDRDVLLVRADARPPALHFSDVHTHIYAASLPFNGLKVPAGWISASVHTGNRHFVLVATHLQSNVPGVPAATDVQVAQAKELLYDLRNVVVPVVICGDFNSDANDTPGVVDDSPTADLINAAGYIDVWHTLGISDLGNTWPLYLEDQINPTQFPIFTPFERIDLVFSRGMEVISAEQVIAPAASGDAPPFASDHAGVIVALKP